MSDPEFSFERFLKDLESSRVTTEGRVVGYRYNWDCLAYGDRPMPPPTTGEVTSCKHGRGPCDRCGTSPTNDRRHSTVRGKGVVARIGR